MLKIFDIIDSCTGCGACVSSCPKQALKLSYDKEGFYYPHLDNGKCVNCKICEKSCHVLNTEVPALPSHNFKAYMVKANDKRIVNSSSSGGAFTLLANHFLAEGGIVYGARYNFKNERLEHCSTQNCSLNELRKSKYIESYLGDTFKIISDQLAFGHKVLFCGTPCQVEGLHHFLMANKTDTTNLLLVRFICHGVPSNQFFTEYKHYEEERHRSEMVSFDFRPKTNGWRSSDWKMTFSNGKEEKGPYYYYYYYYYFQLSNLLRRSCYSCKRVFHEIADVTIGDFWGIHTYRPENKDQEGISVLFVHNEKAASMLPLIQNNCSIEEIPHSAIEYIYREANDREKKLSEREKFSMAIQEHGYMFVAKKYLGTLIFKRKITGFINSSIKKVAKSIQDYAAGKVTEKSQGDVKLLKENSVMQANADLIGKMSEFVADSEVVEKMNSRVKAARLNVNDREQFAVHIAPTASGPFVMTSTSMVGELKQSERKLSAIDMEGYALYYTAHVFDKPALWIKGVSDFMDSNKNDDYHKAASYASACLLMQFIKDKLYD